jgi:hypothetical protein
MKAAPLEELTDEFVAANTEQVGNCLIWAGATTNGIPYVRTSANGFDNKVHRLLFLRAHGYVPPTLHNICGHLRCVNLEHWKVPSGAHYDAKTNRYRASVRIGGKRLRKWFATEDEAQSWYEDNMRTVTKAGASRTEQR